MGDAEDVPPPAARDTAETAACLGWQQAMSRAIETAARIDAAAADADSARAGRLAAKARSMPSVSLFAQSGVGDTPLDQTRDDQAGIQYRQDIFTFGRNRYAQRAAEADLAAARHGVEAARRGVVEEILIALLDYRRVREAAMLLARKQDGYAQGAAGARERLSRRLITLTEASEIRVRSLVAESETAEAQMALDEALIRLQVLSRQDEACIATDGLPAMLEAYTNDIVQLPAGEATARAFDQSAAARGSEAARDAAREGVKAAERSAWPTVSLSAFALYEYDDLIDDYQDESRIGVTLRQDLYAGGQNRAQRMRARADLRRAEAQLEMERIMIEDQVRRALAAVRAQQRVGQSLRAALGEAETQLDATRREYEASTKTLTDLIFATETYYDAALRETQARYRYHASLVTLYGAMGLLGDMAQ